MTTTLRKPLLALALACVVAGACAGVGARAAAPSLGALHSQLSAAQAQQSRLSASVSSLGGLISSLGAQIQLVRDREGLVREQLVRDRAVLEAVARTLRREQTVLARLRARLARARMILSRQLVSQYETSKPDLVSVVINSGGFTQLLEQLAFLTRAQQQQQQLILVTRVAKARADAAAARLTRIEAGDRAIAARAALRERALAGMNALLSSREAALADARAAQQAALDASRRHGAQLQAAISRIEAQQAAAAAAAAAYSAGGGGGGAGGGGATLGASAGWAIPYAIVLCESGGQNLPPNGAGASGYYQIIPATWRLFGGAGAAAYLAPKSEQDAVAARIWNGGAGASNWACAAIVGIG